MRETVNREAMRDLIVEHRVSRAELAERAGVSERTIQRIVHGRRSEQSGHNRYKGNAVSLDVADRLCIALDEQLPEPR